MDEVPCFAILGMIYHKLLLKIHTLLLHVVTKLLDKQSFVYKPICFAPPH